MDEDELRRRAHAWVERTTREQGVPLKVTDPEVIDLVAAIFEEARQKRLQA